MSRGVRRRDDGLRDEEGDLLFEYEVRCPHCAITWWVAGGRHHHPPEEQICGRCSLGTTTRTEEDAEQRREVRNLGIGCLAFVLFAVLLCIGVQWEDRRKELIREREGLARVRQEEERKAESDRRERVAQKFEAAFADAIPPDPAALEKEAMTAGDEKHPYFSLTSTRPDQPKLELGKVAVFGLEVGEGGKSVPRLIGTHFDLPESLQALSPAEVETICWLVDRPDKLTVFNPSTGSQYQTNDRDAVLQDWRTKKLLKIMRFEWNSNQSVTEWLAQTTTAP